jgi:hypothetical protein
LPREIPVNRETDLRATLNCRRCQRSFRLEQTQSQQQPAEKLRSIGQLLADSWELFCQRGWGLLTIYLLIGLVIFIPLLITGLLMPALVRQSSILFWGSLIGAGLFGLLGSAWMMASMFSHICHQQLGVFSAIYEGWKRLWQFAGLLIILGLFITGGSLLFIIPGLVFTIWFFFCHYVLAEEGQGGFSALEKSRQLVQGHWWAVFARFLLLLMVVAAVSSLTARLPLIGTPLNILFSLLLTPFSLLYCYQLYQDLKRSQPVTPRAKPTGFVTPMATALLGWMLIPGLLFAVNNWQKLPNSDLSTENSAIVSKLFNYDQALLLEKSEQLPQPPILPNPEPLTLADYDRLMQDKLLPGEEEILSLGPATLSAEQFWSDERDPHLWLKLQVIDFPNLVLSHRHSARILINKVLDDQDQNRYNPEHSFEHDAFHWVDVSADNSTAESFSGIRNVYLKRGTRPEQIRSISGLLEFNLPLNIKSLKLSRADIGKTKQIAGKALTLEKLSINGITLRYQGKRTELLSIRAVNQQKQLLPETGTIWQKIGQAFSLQQNFSGDIDSVTILVAGDSVTRSYPFEISR